MSLVRNASPRAVLRFLTTTVIVLAVLFTAIITIGYFSVPYLLPRYLSSYLQTQGVQSSKFVMGRPGFSSMVIHHINLSVDDTEMDAKSVVLRYHLAGLFEQQLDEVNIQQLLITLPVSSSATSDEPIASPWSLVPVSNVSIADFELRGMQPAAELKGQLSMTPSEVAANFKLSSAVLPEDLKIDLHLQPTGELTMDVAGLASSPVLSLSGHYDNKGKIEFEGDLQLEGSAFEFVLQALGIYQPIGFIQGSFAGSGTWPVQSTASFTVSGLFNVDVQGDLPTNSATYGIKTSGLSYKGAVNVVVAPTYLSLETSDSTLGVHTLEIPGGQYVFSDTLTSVTYKVLVPLVNAEPDLSIATLAADLNLAINVPGAAGVGEWMSLYDSSLKGLVSVNLGNKLHQVSGNLTVAASQIDFENTLYRLESAPIKMDFDLAVPNDKDTDLLDALSGKLSTDLVATIVSVDQNAPIQKLTLDMGIQILLKETVAQAAIAQSSLVSVTANEQKFTLETLDTFSSNIGFDGTMVSQGGNLRAQFSMDVGNVQRVNYPNARVFVESLLVTADDIQARGQFRSDSSSKAMPVNFFVKADQVLGAGTFDVHANHKISRQFLKKALPGWVADYDLSAGQFDFSVAGTFDFVNHFAFDSSGVVTLKRGVAQYEDVTLTGVSSRFPIRITNERLLVGPGAASIRSVDIGFPASDISFQLETDGDSLSVNDFSASVLSADISIEQMLYDINDESARFNVQVIGLPVASVLALEGDDIQGDGILDGQMPVVLNKVGANIEGGTLTARPPGGYLRYQGDLPSTNPGLDLAIRALRNFEYQAMDVGVDYEPDGSLAALIRLRGKSPDVENGRAIHFNLNVTENVPALLESIRASETTQRRIQQRLSQ